MKNTNVILIIAVILSLFIGTAGWFAFGMYGGMNHGNHMMNNYDGAYWVDHSMMDMSDMDPMSMSMADMGAMLEWKTGDELDKAFLEGMIPHHQGAIDMAKYLVDAQHPELKAMGTEIIIAQQAEIDQMNAWLLQWGYTQ